jgi:hypothetical protein
MYEKRSIGTNYWKKDGDGYVVSNPVENGFRYEDIHAQPSLLAPIDLAFDEAAEKEKAEKNGPGALRAISAAFKGGDDADKANYLFIHHEAGARGRVFLDALKKAARQLNIADTTRVKSSPELSINTQNIARAHIGKHLAQFGID